MAVYIANVESFVVGHNKKGEIDEVILVDRTKFHQLFNGNAELLEKLFKTYQEFIK